MYGKVFSSIFDSTLVADGGWLPTYIFMSMIAIADKDGIVDIAPKALFRRLGFREYDSKVSFSEFQKAIEYLQSEDPESNSPAEKGKRVIPMAETMVGGNRGWLIVNYMEYRKKASKEEPKGASTERVRRFRERNKNNNLQDGNGIVTGCNGSNGNGNGHTDTDTDTDTDKNKNIGRQADRFNDFYEAYPKKRKRKDAEKIWNRKRLNAKADQIISDINNRILFDKRWIDGFIPDPTTYLNQERWDDEIEACGVKDKPAPPKEFPND